MAETAGRRFSLLIYLDKVMEDLRAQIRPAIDSADGGAIHKARVATRRLKAALDLLRPVVGEDRRKPLARALRNLRRKLGPMRDVKVMRKHLNDLVGGRHADAAAWLDARLSEEAGKLCKKIRRKTSPSRLLSKLDAWLAIRDHAAEAKEAIDSLLAQSLHLQLDAFAEQAALLAGEGLNEIHSVRIAGKNLRYTLELADAHGHDLPRKTIRAFKRMQDALGLWHDFVVLAEQAMAACVSAALPQCDALLQRKMTDLTRKLMARSSAHLRRFTQLWSAQGVEIAAAIREAFPLTIALTEPQTDPGPSGSREIPAPEAPSPDAASAA